jgi:hypothetical protein
MPAIWVAAVVASLALLAGGCGDGGSSGTAVASVPTGSPSASQPRGQAQPGDLVKYAQCMRSHGVPNFPDPSAQGALDVDARKLGIDPQGPVFKAAEEACRSLQPQGGPPPDPKQAEEAQRQLLAYSKCMRSKGISDYPDPAFVDGGAKLELPRGLDANSPQFKAAEKACQKLMPQGGQLERSGEPGGGA